MDRSTSLSETLFISNPLSHRKPQAPAHHSLFLTFPLLFIEKDLKMAMQSKEAPNSLIGSGPGSPEPPPSPLQPEPASLAPSTPDLSEIPGTELLKMPEKTAIGVELNGELYGSVYRQLQIKKEKCQDFYNNIIRVFRNKNWILIVRSSEKSLEKTTDVLLRAYGSVVWIAGSEWQMDADELDEGEEQLMYVKGEGQENPDNARYAIGESSNRPHEPVELLAPTRKDLC